MKEEHLKKFQLWLAIIVGLISFAVAAYNFKNIYLTKKKSEPAQAVQPAPSPFQTAVEEVGASWVKKIGSPRNILQQNTTSP